MSCFREIAFTFVLLQYFRFENFLTTNWTFICLSYNRNDKTFYLYNDYGRSKRSMWHLLGGRQHLLIGWEHLLLDKWIGKGDRIANLMVFNKDLSKFEVAEIYEYLQNRSIHQQQNQSIPNFFNFQLLVAISTFLLSTIIIVLFVLTICFCFFPRFKQTRRSNQRSSSKALDDQILNDNLMDDTFL